MLGLTSSKLDWGSYIISIAKTASKKIGALIRSVKFLSPEVALDLYKSTIRPCLKHCFMPCLVPLDATQNCQTSEKRICRNVGPALATFLEPLGHRRNVASLSLLYRYYFGKCSSKLAQPVQLPFSRGRSTRYSDLSSFLDVTRTSIPTVSFL